MSESHISHDAAFEQKHVEDLERIRGFRLMDDDFMSKVFEDKSCDALLLRAYNVEIQRSDRGAGAKRARYNSSLLDANLTHSGDSYSDLNETYIVFITERDILKRGLPIYHIDRVVRETGDIFEDEAHIIYVNSQIKDETALGKLMHDFFCTDATEMYYSTLADRVRYFKEDTKGVANMCRAMEEMRNEAAREATHAKAVAVALSMLADEMPHDKIAKYSGLSLDEIATLSQKRPA